MSSVRIALVAVFMSFTVNSCGLWEEETLSATYNEKFRLSLSCDSGIMSKSQYLRVSVGSREIFKSFTRSFDTFPDCARSVEKMTVMDGSTIELLYSDGPRRYAVDVMRDF